jgi:hypothetical protein
MGWLIIYDDYNDMSTATSNMTHNQPHGSTIFIVL